jgi:DNA-binding LacI/PurR family transcriptional regulator
MVETLIDVAAVMQPTPANSGKTMAEMLLKLIDGSMESQNEHVLMQPQFVGGKSIGLARY